MSNLFTMMGVLFWMAIGAVIGIGSMTAYLAKRGDASASPYGELLGKSCWVNEGGEYSKFRVVAVSHKGSVAIRRWDDLSGKHAKWIRRQDIEKNNCVYFDEGDIR